MLLDISSRITDSSNKEVIIGLSFDVSLSVIIRRNSFNTAETLDAFTPCLGRVIVYRCATSKDNICVVLSRYTIILATSPYNIQYIHFFLSSPRSLFFDSSFVSYLELAKAWSRSEGTFCLLESSFR